MYTVSLEDFLTLGIDIFQVEWPSKIDTNWGELKENSSDTLNSGGGGALYDLLSFLHVTQVLITSICQSQSGDCACSRTKKK